MSESTFKPGDVLYRAADVVYRHDGPEVIVQIGVVSQCGKWVECGDLGYAMSTSRLWHLRRCDAEVSVEAAIRSYADNCREYAAQLRRRVAT
jgi:hypothetical protein